MCARKHFGVWILLFAAGCASCSWADEEPKLLPAEVVEAADAKASEGGYDLVGYDRKLPNYYETAGTWEVDYYYKIKPPGGDRRAFVARVHDATGLVSLDPRRSPVAAAPAAPGGTRAGGLSFWKGLAVALFIAVSLRFASWLCGRFALARRKFY